MYVDKVTLPAKHQDFSIISELVGRLFLSIYLAEARVPNYSLTDH